MKKKIAILMMTIFLLCGCTSIQDSSYEDILDMAASNYMTAKNTYRSGYKYYLPKGIRVLSQRGSNEILSEGSYIYYMYVDYVSYYNKIEESYKEKEDVVYSKPLRQKEKFGYIEIKNTSNGKYFIEIMYNYAKIEVIVDKSEVEKTLAYSMSILSSIEYQENALKSLMGEDVLSTSEVEHNIFETAKTESDYLQIVEEYGVYEEKEIDPDFIRR